MKKTIKLRDLTEEQYKQWVRCHCVNLNEDCADEVTCGHCPFNWIACQMLNENIHDLWTAHKDIYSDKFLDQTIEIEVPDLLTEEEKGILKTIISIMRVKVDCVVITHTIASHNFLELDCGKNTYEGICIKDGLFKGLEPIKKHTLEDLGLEDK